MTFLDPIFFFLWIPLALIIVLYFFVLRKRRASLQYSSVEHVKEYLKKMGDSWRGRLIELPFFLKILSFCLLVVALARPQVADVKVKKNIEGIDIMIVLDVSDSMLIEDMKPFNRIEAAKETIRRFIKHRVSDRIGLIVFSGEAFTMVPLTFDYDLVLNRVDEVATSREKHIKDGTAIGVALANAANRLKDSAAKSKVVIFVTDGESNSGTIDPSTGLEIVKGYGIKIYSIGIGTDGPKKIPIFRTDALGNRVKTYEPFEDEVNEVLLGRMASETGGKFFRANREDSLPKVFEEIDQLEKTKIDKHEFVKYSEKFHHFLYWAIAFYIGAWFLSISWLRRAP